MRQYRIGILLILLLFGCKEKSDQYFYEILNENFLVFTDTIAYRTGSFFLIPDDTNKYNKVSNIIEIDTFIHKNQRLEIALNLALEKYGKVNFLKELSKSSIIEIDLLKIIKSGQYKIIPSKPAYKYENERVGKMWFSNFALSNNQAVLIVSKQSSPKSGVSNGYLFKKQSTDWKIDTVFELERW